MIFYVFSHTQTMDYSKARKVILRRVLEIIPPSNPNVFYEVLASELNNPLTLRQLLLALRYYLTKGLDRYVLINTKMYWFELITGLNTACSIRNNDLNLLCLLQVTPYFYGTASSASYESCNLLCLHDNFDRKNICFSPG
jgi:hypothetical protein